MTTSALSNEQIEEWRRRIRSTTFANYHYEMGVALLRTGEPDHAVAAFRRALDIQPDHHAAAFELEEALTAQARPDEARAVGELAGRMEPNYRVIGVCRRVAALLGDERLDEASGVLDALTEAERSHPALTLARAILLLHGNRTEEAGLLLDGLPPADRLPHADTLASALAGVAQSLIRNMREADAARVLDILLALEPDHEQGRLQRARLAQAQGDHARVLALVDRPELFSSAVIAHQYRFLALLGLGRNAEARRALDVAETLTPGHGVLLAFRALAALADDHVAEAEAAANAARKVLEGNPWVQVANALVHVAQGRGAEADKDLAGAVRADGNAIRTVLARIGPLAEPLRSRLAALGGAAA